MTVPPRHPTVAAGRPRRRRLPGAAAAAAAALLGPPATAVAQTMPAPGAGPTGGRVVAGSAGIARGAGTTTITQSSDRAAVDWQRFDVGSQHHVRFDQPSARAWTLNRVAGPDPSVIAGRVTANGGVALVNPSGMVFAEGAQVNVAGLIASAPGITTENFMAGRMVFDRAPRPGARVENRGAITVADRGLAALVAPEVANSGAIRARLGRVALAGGAEAYALDLAGDGLLSIEVTQAVRQAPSGPGVALATNSGTIEAEGGSVLLTAHAASGLMETLVSQRGRVAAPTAPASAGGEPERPGAVAVRAAGGGARVEGSVAATGGPASRGGSVEVNAAGGGAVALAPGAVLDASGGAGGGRVLVGTSGVGRGQQRLAARTEVAPGATLRADATRRGQGGTVAVNSAGRTAFRGAASARGGAEGGDGGLVELSGQGAMEIAGAVDVGAPAGAAGTLLLDPLDIAVVPGPAGIPPSFVDPIQQNGGFVSAATGPAGGTLNVTNGAVQAFPGTVTLQAVREVTVAAPVAKTNGGLVLDAQGGTVDVQQPVSATGLGVSIAGAAVRIRAGVTAAAPGFVSITTRGGDLRVEGPAEGGTGALTAGGQVIANLAGALSNSGTITALGGGVSVQRAAALSNSGTIAAPGGEIVLQPAGPLDNTGEIAAGGRVFLGAVSNGTTDITNAGRVAAGTEVTAFAAGRFTNSGSVTSGTGGIVVNSDGGIDNPGSLAAGTALRLSSNGGNLTNSGTMSTRGGPIDLTAGGSVTASGAITASGTSPADGRRGVAIVSLSNGPVALSGARVEADVVRISASLPGSGVAGGTVGSGTVRLDGASLVVGESILFYDPVAIDAGALSTIRPRYPGLLPAVTFSVRPVDRPATVPPTADPAGTVRLNLDAGGSSVTLLLDGGRAEGTLLAGRLEVYGIGGSADLFGTLAGRADRTAFQFGAAFGAGGIPAPRPAYRFNGCVLGAPTCDPLPEIPVVRPRPPEIQVVRRALLRAPINERPPVELATAAIAAAAAAAARGSDAPVAPARLSRTRGRLSDPDVIVPGAVEEDY